MSPEGAWSGDSPQGDRKGPHPAPHRPRPYNEHERGVALRGGKVSWRLRPLHLDFYIALLVEKPFVPDVTSSGKYPPSDRTVLLVTTV